MLKISYSTMGNETPAAMRFISINPSPTSAALMRRQIGSTLVQIMACRLFGAKPLSKPMMVIVSWNLMKF